MLFFVLFLEYGILSLSISDVVFEIGYWILILNFGKLLMITIFLWFWGFLALMRKTMSEATISQQV